MTFDFTTFSAFLQSCGNITCAGEVAEGPNLNPSALWAAMTFEFQTRDFTQPSVLTDLEVTLTQTLLASIVGDPATKQGLNDSNNGATQYFDVPYSPGFLPSSITATLPALFSSLLVTNGPNFGFNAPITWAEAFQLIVWWGMPDLLNGSNGGPYVYPTAPLTEALVSGGYAAAVLPVCAVATQPAKQFMTPEGGTAQVGVPTYGPPHYLFGNHNLDERITMFLIIFMLRLFNGDSIPHAYIVAKRHMNLFGHLNYINFSGYFAQITPNQFTGGRYLPFVQATQAPDGALITTADVPALQSLLAALHVWGIAAYQKWYPEAFQAEPNYIPTTLSDQQTLSANANPSTGAISGLIAPALYGVGALGGIAALYKKSKK